MPPDRKERRLRAWPRSRRQSRRCGVRQGGQATSRRVEAARHRCAYLMIYESTTLISASEREARAAMRVRRGFEFWRARSCTPAEFFE